MLSNPTDCWIVLFPVRICTTEMSRHQKPSGAPRITQGTSGFVSCLRVFVTKSNIVTLNHIKVNFEYKKYSPHKVSKPLNC